MKTATRPPSPIPPENILQCSSHMYIASKSVFKKITKSVQRDLRRCTF